MIYDKPISLLAMPDTTGIPSPGCLVPVFDAWCAEKTVYAKRFWEAVANGSRVDKLVELPLHRDVPAAGYARLGGHTYRVEQTQTGEDGAGISVLPMGKHPKSSTGKRRGKRRSNGSYQGTNAEVAFILEYGSPRIGATHFMENTAEESEQEVYNAMDAELTQILRERGL